MSSLILVGSLSIPRTGSRLEGRGSTGFSRVRDPAELSQVLLRDILSVHWARAVTHWDGAGLEKGCDVSNIKQHL